MPSMRCHKVAPFREGLDRQCLLPIGHEGECSGLVVASGTPLVGYPSLEERPLCFPADDLGRPVDEC